MDFSKAVEASWRAAVESAGRVFKEDSVDWRKDSLDTPMLDTADREIKKVGMTVAFEFSENVSLGAQWLRRHEY